MGSIWFFPEVDEITLQHWAAWSGILGFLLFTVFAVVNRNVRKAYTSVRKFISGVSNAVEFSVENGRRISFLESEIKEFGHPAWDTISSIDSRLSLLESEMTPNHGSSIKDAINRIEKSVDRQGMVISLQSDSLNNQSKQITGLVEDVAVLRGRFTQHLEYEA